MTDARDILFVSAIVFILGISLVSIFYAANTMVDAVSNNSVINSSQASIDAFQSVKTKITPRFDYLIFVVFIGIVLMIIVSGWFVAGNAIGMFLYFASILIGIIMGSLLSYGWDMFKSKSVSLAAIATNNFPITNHLISHLPLYVGVLGCIGLVVMFAKPSNNI